MLVPRTFWSFFIFLVLANCTPKPLPRLAEEAPRVEISDRVDHEIILPWGQEEQVLVTVNKT